MTSDSSPSTYTSITMSPIRANVIGILFAAPLFLGPCALYVFVWGETGMSAPPSILGGVAAVLVGVIVHELLHGVGFLLGGARREEVDFGIHWHVLSPYAHCQAPLRASAYRISLALPALALGLLPAALGLVAGSFWLVFFGALMLAVAGGDAAVLGALRRVPQQAWVQDHPSDIGCLLLDDGTAETSPEPVSSLSENAPQADPTEAEETNT